MKIRAVFLSVITNLNQMFADRKKVDQTWSEKTLSDQQKYSEAFIFFEKIGKLKMCDQESEYTRKEAFVSTHA